MTAKWVRMLRTFVAVEEIRTANLPSFSDEGDSIFSS